MTQVVHRGLVRAAESVGDGGGISVTKLAAQIRGGRSGRQHVDLDSGGNVGHVGGEAVTTGHLKGDQANLPWSARRLEHRARSAHLQDVDGAGPGGHSSAKRNAVDDAPVVEVMVSDLDRR